LCDEEPGQEQHDRDDEVTVCLGKFIDVRGVLADDGLNMQGNARHQVKYPDPVNYFFPSFFKVNTFPQQYARNAAKGHGYREDAVEQRCENKRKEFFPAYSQRGNVKRYTGKENKTGRVMLQIEKDLFCFACHGKWIN
jgi:hypothetical protein